MENALVPVIGVLGTIITTLLTWVGWLIKKRIDESKENTKYQEEMHLLISQFLDNQSLTLELIKEISRGLTLALKSDDLQFESFHKSGLMNGESVAHREMIEDYLKSVEDFDEKLKGIDVQDPFEGATK